MKHRITVRTISLLIAIFASLCVGYNASSAEAEAAASFRETEYARLYSFISRKNHRYYRTNTAIPKVSDGPWKQDGMVGIVAKNEGPGLKPVYQFMKGDSFGARFFYESNLKQVDLLERGVDAAGQWTNQGIAFYLAATNLPDTVKLFRLAYPAQIEWSENIGSVGTLVAPEKLFLTTDTAERDKAIAAGWKSDSLGWIWTKAPEVPLPDLTVEKTFVQGPAIGAIIRNVGSVGSPEVWVRLRVLNAAGQQVAYEDQRLSALFNSMPGTVVFKVPAETLIGKSYQVTVDPINRVKESNESNNEGQVTAYQYKINLSKVDPEAANKLRAPTFAISAVAPSGQKTLYKLSVSNWDRFKPEWFQTVQSGSPNPCNSAARLQMVIFVVRTGMPIKVGCKPLNSQQDIKSLQFETGMLKDSDRVQLTLIDRKDNSEYKSEPFSVGWFGIKVAGCTYFLGRASSFLCATQQAFNDCESLRKQGKPIQCTLRGSK